MKGWRFATENLPHTSSASIRIMRRDRHQSQRCPGTGARVDGRRRDTHIRTWLSTPGTRLGRPLRLAVQSMFFWLAGVLVTMADVVDIHPAWMPLDGHGDAGAAVAEIFRSSEVLQIYHLQATAQLYEQGGLNHDMSFFLTAVAFYSLERPDTKVSLAFHPTNMTISLLPAISEDGRELRWDHQAASTSYVMGVDQAYWTAGSYMGETTGAFFSYAVEFSLDYHVRNPRYQPFSVYDDYPGREFLAASSCDEYVWALLSAAQARGVRLTPALLPQKHKIVIYSHSEPEVVVLNDDRGGDAEPDGLAEGGGVAGKAGLGGGANNSSGGGGDGGGAGRAGPENGVEGGSASPDSWSSSLSSSSGEEEAGGNERRGRSTTSAAKGTNSTRSSSSGGSEEREEEMDDGDGDVPGAGSGDDQRRRGLLRRRRTRTLLSASSRVDLLPDAHATPVPGWASAVSSDAGVAVVRAAGETRAEGGAASGDGEGEQAAETPHPAAADMDDWQQVVAYYQSLEMCLQERKFSFVTSLKDFAQYFDCLDDVAFISIGPHEYYKVNLTSTKLDHISLPEELPEVPIMYEGFTRVDTAIAIWILLIIACGVHGLLWQAAVIQHWLKSTRCLEQVAELPAANGDVDMPPLGRQGTLKCRITTAYLRLGQLFLGKPEDYPVVPASPPNAAAGRNCHEDSSEGGDRNNGDRPQTRSPAEGGAHHNNNKETTPPDAEGAGMGWGAGNPKNARRAGRGGEEGLEMRVTKDAVPPIRKENEEEEEEEGDIGEFVGSARGGAVSVRAQRAIGDSVSPTHTFSPAPIKASERKLGVVRSGRVGELYLGAEALFAGSPRGERSRVLDGASLSDSEDGGGEELLGGVMESYMAGITSPPCSEEDS